MRCPVEVRNERRVLCVFPRYAPSFGTFQHSYQLMDGVRAFMPPQGILVVAAYMPERWQVRLIDENMVGATDQDYAWADVVFVSGMHVQRAEMQGIARRAHALGKATVIGGPSVSACPEHYPEFDYLHIGEIGDATDKLIGALDADPRPPAQQIRFETAERLPMPDFPIPAYELIEGRRYFLGSVQFSSGCPYQCEFCDIPVLYGRQPRLKEPAQILAELDKLREAGVVGSVYFVDDNFIANKKAARELLPHLIRWQKEKGYPFQFACEATLNIAQCPDILEMMREAYFGTVFCGIETPELEALASMRKGHNTVMPVLDAIKILNDHGLEVVSGIILGLDTDTAATPDHLKEFIDLSNIPVLTINLLQALPKTALWTRLDKAGRLNENPSLESNVDFLRPYEEVLRDWHACIGHAYTPDAIYRRFAYNQRNTFPNRIHIPVTRARLSPGNLRRGIVSMAKILFQLGGRGDYRRTFWRMALPALRAGKIEEVIQIGLVAHHMITFARDCAAGRQNASFYSAKERVDARELEAA